MPRKLDEIRTLVEGETSRLRYPITYRLVQDGELDISVLSKALTQDLIGENSVLTLDDLYNEQILEDSQMESARALAKELMKRPGIQSGQRGVAYIQSMGRNSRVSHEFNDSLKSPYRSTPGVVSGMEKA